MEQFCTIVALLENVAESSGSVHGKEAHLRQFFNEFASHRQHFRITSDQADEVPSIFPILRLLLPGLDRERKAYGLREKSLADAYIGALALDRKGGDAVRLLSAQFGGDLADRLVPLLRGRCPARGTLTVAQVNSRLDALGTSAHKELSYLIEHGASLDHRWLVRIVLRNLRLGQLTNRRILQLYHPSAPALYDTTGDLRHVVQLIEDGKQCPGANGDDGTDSLVRLGHFVRPMLCQRLELRQVGELLAKHTLWLEPKMDGERFQVHKDGARFSYLSRNGIDYSATFGATADQIDGTLTPLLAQLLADSVRSAILDGEMMVFDRRTMRYRDKCDGGADVKALRLGNADLRACFCVYDVLLLNGRPLTELPYGERARLLDTLLVREQIGYVQRCQREPVRDRAHLVLLLNAAIDARQEGVVLKREDVPYRPNRRAGSGWYKIKPDYIAGLVTDFDLLVLGGYYNARRTFVNTFVVGAIDGDTRHYHSVVKVSNGLSVAQWQILNQSLRAHWRERDCGDERLKWGHAGPPDVWIEPVVSIVLQLKGSELVRSDAYAAGYTIRFPRIVAVRSDKLPDEVCTVGELQTLAGEASKSKPADDRRATKLAKRHVTLQDLEEAMPAMSTKTGRGRKRGLAVEMTTKPTAAQDGAVSEILRGKDICVMGGATQTTAIRVLEALVRQHGGRPVANPGLDTFAIVVSGPDTFKVRKYCETRRWNVVRSDWLLRAVAAGATPQLEPFRPAEVLASTVETELALAETYDRYGDSYTRPVSPASFTGLLRREQPNAGIWNGTQLTESELVRAERTLLGPSRQRARRLFRGQSARLFLLSPSSAEAEQTEEALVCGLRAQRQMLRFVRHGGRWLRDAQPGPVAYVFYPPSPLPALRALDLPFAIARWLRTIGETDQPTPVSLSTDWIGRSLERGELCEPEEMLLQGDELGCRWSTGRANI